MADACGDFTLVGQDYVVNKIANHLECVAVLETDPAAKGIGKCWQFLHLYRHSGGLRGGHRRTALHADAVDAALRAPGLYRKRDTGDQAAA